MKRGALCITLVRCVAERVVCVAVCLQIDQRQFNITLCFSLLTSTKLQSSDDTSKSSRFAITAIIIITTTTTIIITTIITIIIIIIIITPTAPAALSITSSLAQQVLLSYAARVNSQDVLGNTPLHYAAENGDEDTIDLLLSVGCETTLENKQGKTPLQILPEFPWQEAIARGTSDPPPVTATNVAASEVAQLCFCLTMLQL